MHSKITAGPQSSILEGVTWEEIKKMQVMVIFIVIVIAI